MYCDWGLTGGWYHSGYFFWGIWAVVVFCLAAFFLFRKKGSGRQALACPACGGEVQHTFLRCPHCAATLKSNCQECSRIVESTWKYCPSCRTEVSNV